MKRFRIKENDTVRATATNEEARKLLASLYDSGFTTIEQIKDTLLRKIPYTNARKLNICIVNENEQTSKTFNVLVNR